MKPQIPDLVVITKCSVCYYRDGTMCHCGICNTYIYCLPCWEQITFSISDRQLRVDHREREHGAVNLVD